MQSIWSNVRMLQQPKLSEDLDVDIAVIGGGMTGMLIAYELTRRGFDVVVLEAERIGSGQTGGTTAKITSQHGHVYARLIEQCGHEKAAQYARANHEAIFAFERIVESEGIACDLERKRAYLYARRDSAPLEAEMLAASSLGLPASLVPSRDLPFPTAGAVMFSDQARFHPLKFLKGLSEHVRVRICALSGTK